MGFISFIFLLVFFGLLIFLMGDNKKEKESTSLTETYWKMRAEKAENKIRDIEERLKALEEKDKNFK